MSNYEREESMRLLKHRELSKTLDGREALEYARKKRKAKQDTCLMGGIWLLYIAGSEKGIKEGSKDRCGSPA